MKNFVEIYDTTLRDGTQGEGVSFSVADKLRVAEKLDAFGVHYVEGGWPGSNPKDIEFFKQAAKRKWRNTQIAAFGSTRRKKIAAKDDPQVKLLIAAKTPVVTLFGKTWLLHVKEVLRTTPKENLAMIADTIRFLKKKGKKVIYDAEHALDGYKDDPEYAMATWLAAEEAGADLVVLCDTNGGSLPSEVAAITAAARATLSCNIGIHTHNDIGLGVANALVAVDAGATQVQGTINGYGERTGNCNLISVIPNISLKMGKRSIPAAQIRKLRDLSRFVDEVANLMPDRRQPWVGATAFAHKGGMHVNAVQKVAQSFEHCDSGCCWQQAPDSCERLGGSQQHRDEGPGNGHPCEQRHAAIDKHPGQGQGAGAPRLRLRGCGRVAWRCSFARRLAGWSRHFTWRHSTSPCTGMVSSMFARRPSRCVSATRRPTQSPTVMAR